MALDPFTLVYDALWELLETHEEFHDKVRLGNRIKFSSYGPDDPIKHEVATADMPEVRLICVGGTPHLQRASGVSFVKKRFEVQVLVNDLRYTEELFPLDWEIYRAMSKWEAVLDALQWPEPTNKITNPGFETESPFGWLGVIGGGGTGSIARDTTRKFGGNASVKVIHSNITGYYYANQAITPATSASHRAKARVWIPSTNVPTEYVRLFLGGFSNNEQVDADLTLTDRWQVLTIPSWTDEGGDIRLIVSTTSATNGIAYWDEIEVREIDAARQFVKLARPTNIDTGVSSADLARGARGWLSVWACEVEMWFSTDELQQTPIFGGTGYGTGGYGT